MRLYDTWRPQTLGDVVGQDKAVKRLGMLIERKRLGGQALWLSGNSGTGKTTLARIAAREFCGPTGQVLEYDSADQFGQAEYEALDYDVQMRSLFGNRAYIINEAHGLRKPIIRQLLGMLERIPSDMLLIFTTTRDGQQGLFEAQIDASPLLSRCLNFTLTNQGLAKPFAERAREIAVSEGLDGRPIAAYVKLLQECHNNMREALQRIEGGEMLG